MVGIFDPSSDLSISTDELSQDLSKRARGRLTDYFSRSPNILALINALGVMEQELYDAAIGVLAGFQLGNAVELNLDILGRWVGQNRILISANIVQFFGPDADDEELGPPDSAPAWVINAPITGTLPADDIEYRRIILGKIFKNHVKNATIPEMIQFSLLLTGRNVSFKLVGPAELRIIVPADMPLNDIITLLFVFTDSTADTKNIMPIAATGRFASIMYKPVTAFVTDSGTSLTDEALMGASFDR